MIHATRPSASLAVLQDGGGNSFRMYQGTHSRARAGQPDACSGPAFAARLRATFASPRAIAMPEETRVGRIVHISRGYTVAEILVLRDAGEAVAGYSVFGYRSNTAQLFATQDEAIAELTALADQR